MTDYIESSWEVFDECKDCGTGAGQPCYNLAKSTSKNLIHNINPHKSRRKLKRIRK